MEKNSLRIKLYSIVNYSALWELQQICFMGVNLAYDRVIWIVH